MAFCNRCGAEPSEGARFCDACGNELREPSFEGASEPKRGAYLPLRPRTLLIGAVIVVALTAGVVVLLRTKGSTVDSTSAARTLATHDAGSTNPDANPDAASDYKAKVRPDWTAINVAWTTVHNKGDPNRFSVLRDLDATAHDLQLLVRSLAPAPDSVRLLHEQLSELADQVITWVDAFKRHVSANLEYGTPNYSQSKVNSISDEQSQASDRVTRLLDETRPELQS